MLPEAITYSIGVLGAASIVFSIVYARLLRQRYDPRACMQSMKRLAEEASERERFWLSRVKQLCGLSEDAMRILESLERGEIQILCKDGSPAVIAAGKIVCLGVEGRGTSE